MAVEVIMPKLTDHMEAGTIVRWLVSDGTEVQAHEPILEIETDKAASDVESPAAGIVVGIRVEEGDLVPVGEVLAFVAAPGEPVPPLPRLAAGVELTAKATTAVTPVAPARASQPVPATPAARRLARELGTDLSLVTGSGPGGRITEQDVRTFAAQSQAAGTSGRSGESASAAKQPPAPVARGGEEYERRELSAIQRVSAERMTLSKQTAPHFATTVHVDMSEVERVRRRVTEQGAEAGEKLSYTTLLVKVAATALRKHPLANAEFADGFVKVYRQVNVAVAVGGDNGLVTPVVHRADDKSLSEIERELSSFRERSKSLQFAPEELAGATFTVSNLGMFGIEQFTAIINPPQSAILAMGRVASRPVGLPDGSIALRPIANLTLSADHRVMDGVAAARFLGEVKGLLECPYRLL